MIPTAQILLRSQNAYDQQITLRDSQYFLFPLLLARRTRDVQTEALYTLSQLFIELNNSRISRRSVHLQLYTYSDIIAQAVRISLGPLKMFAHGNSRNACWSCKASCSPMNRRRLKCN